jgi:hypothetical protein
VRVGGSLTLNAPSDRGALSAFRMGSNGASLLVSNAPARRDAAFLERVIGARC